MGKKIGRNDPCPCGSGKKYKLCCLNKLSEEEIRKLYLRQLDLATGLNDVNNCYTILNIGEQIISNQRDSICATAGFTGRDEMLINQSFSVFLAQFYQRFTNISGESDLQI